MLILHHLRSNIYYLSIAKTNTNLDGYQRSVVHTHLPYSSRFATNPREEDIGQQPPSQPSSHWAASMTSMKGWERQLGHCQHLNISHNKVSSAQFRHQGQVYQIHDCYKYSHQHHTSSDDGVNSGYHRPGSYKLLCMRFGYIMSQNCFIFQF